MPKAVRSVTCVAERELFPHHSEPRSFLSPDTIFIDFTHAQATVCTVVCELTLGDKPGKGSQTFPRGSRALALRGRSRCDAGALALRRLQSNSTAVAVRRTEVCRWRLFRHGLMGTAQPLTSLPLEWLSVLISWNQLPDIGVREDLTIEKSQRQKTTRARLALVLTRHFYRVWRSDVNSVKYRQLGCDCARVIHSH